MEFAGQFGHWRTLAEVQKAAENQKILEDEIFERLKTLEFQAEELKGIFSAV